MSLTYHFVHSLLFNISNIWCEINSPPTLPQSTLRIYLENWFFIKMRYRLWTPRYSFFVKKIEGDLVHTETVCFISSWVSLMPQQIGVIAILRLWKESLCVLDFLSHLVDLSRSIDMAYWNWRHRNVGGW